MLNITKTKQASPSLFSEKNRHYNRHFYKLCQTILDFVIILTVFWISSSTFHLEY